MSIQLLVNSYYFKDDPYKHKPKKNVYQNKLAKQTFSIQSQAWYKNPEANKEHTKRKQAQNQ